MGGAAAEVAPAPGLHTPGGEPGAAALEPSLLRVLILKLPSTGSTHCPLPVLFSPSIPTTDHTLILLHLFLDLHLILLHSIDSDLGPGLQEGVHDPGLPQPLDPAAGARGEGCGPLPGHRARASLGHGIRSPWPCHHPRPHLEAGHGEVGLLGHGVRQELGAGLTHPQPGHTLARAAHHALGPAIPLGRNTLEEDCSVDTRPSPAVPPAGPGGTSGTCTSCRARYSWTRTGAARPRPWCSRARSPGTGSWAAADSTRAASVHNNVNTTHGHAPILIY